MALNPNRYAATAGTVSQEEIDSGLRSYMLRVYNYMALGVALTGGLVFAMANDITLLQAAFDAKWIIFIALIGMGFFSHKIITMRSTVAAHVFYWAYCALWGVLIAPMVAGFLQQDPALVARAFFITTGMFAGISLFGYTTKKNLSAFATFFMMASIGLLIAILVNVFFLQSTMFSLVTSGAVVLLFAGITAWETQMIKNMYMENLGDSQITKYALFGALMLYGSFVTMFIHILNILAILRGE
ncbi:MAG: Bax inhibitor-1/YccA family protein [Alphaproteobacteria bacterium]